jgi:hypothetical protein
VGCHQLDGLARVTICSRREAAPLTACPLHPPLQLSEATASSARVTAAPFVHWLLRNVVTHFSPATLAPAFAVELSPQATRHLAAAGANEAGGVAFFHAATGALPSLPHSPPLTTLPSFSPSLAPALQIQTNDPDTRCIASAHERVGAPLHARDAPDGA